MSAINLAQAKSVVLGFPLSCRFLIRGEPPNKNAANEASFQESSFSRWADEVTIVPLKLLHSLSLAVVLSFFSPLLVMSGSLASTWLLTCIPGLGSIGQIPTNMLLDFLDTFGGGCAIQGMLTIGLVCGFVGALFDIYVFYSFRTQKGN